LFVAATDYLSAEEFTLGEPVVQVLAANHVQRHHPFELHDVRAGRQGVISLRTTEILGGE
jgi:hypothetical protein